MTKNKHEEPVTAKDWQKVLDEDDHLLTETAPDVQADVEPSTTMTDKAFDELQAELARLRDEAQKQQEAVLRTRAEMENQRRRFEEELKKTNQFAIENFARELLQVLDSLEYAVTAVTNENTETTSGIKEGVNLTLRVFSSVLEKFNIKSIDPINQPFDSHYHEAMLMQPSDTAEPGTVIAVMQKGYVLHGRVLRPARVTVAKAP